MTQTTPEERFAYVSEEVWRQITCRMSGSYLRGDPDVPTREAWEALCVAVSKRRRSLARSAAKAASAAKTEARRVYMREYMQKRRRGLNIGYAILD